MNNPVSFIDRTGEYTLVEALEDGTYKVVGGSIEGEDEDDLGIYLVDEDGNKTEEKVGHSLFSKSFLLDDDDDGKGEWKGTLDPNSREGISFLVNEIENTSVGGYLDKAFCEQVTKVEGMVDFKDRGSKGLSGEDLQQHRYRGSQIHDGIYASARDFGNVAAGFVAGKAGISWKTTKSVFELRQGLNDGKFKRVKEASQTVKAEQYGWMLGESISNWPK